MSPSEFKKILSEIIDEFLLNQTPEEGYYSEASAQLKIGLELWRRVKSEPKLEYYHKASNSYLDIFIDIGGVRYGVELKYKTRAQKGFFYKNQGAQNNGLYFFLADISRIELFKKDGIIDEGLSVFLTNEPSYWGKKRTGSHVKPFELADGTTIQGTYAPMWKVDAKACPVLHIDGPYSVEWMKSLASGKNGGAFRALVIHG
jgi:hypothetical protein